MTVLADNHLSGAVDAAERLLTTRAGAPVSLADAEDLGGSGRTTVVRARVAQNPVSMDRTLVIKSLPPHEDPRSFQREVVSYQYVTALPNESRPGPQLIASDYDRRLLVLSDLGNGQSMKDLLSGTDVVATSRAVSAWGQALGRMHAATLGGEEDFAALLRRGNGKVGVSDDVGERWARLATSSAASAAALLDVELPDAVAQMLEAGCELFAGGDHRAFSPSDVGPENILLNDDGVQFMDYEWGGFRDAMLDIAYAVATFGQHLSTINLGRRAELESALVDAWRSEVEGIWPRLRNDDELNSRLLTAWLLWSWLSTVWMLPEGTFDTDPAPLPGGIVEDPASVLSHDWALHSNDPRVIVARWTDLADAAARSGETQVAEFASSVGLALQRAWLS
ncbi:hypothetical protein GOEFS_050_00290 [Gordonia effusa NBRC 100432]|uniref:Aminoglycoside phosphotransferase domain-containing protein n=1 Tax=Gordonia effusa NBRC 100432 TaxID=1077974 RepID=H0QZK0_9ACTN|nr:hypothetical protein [Gordonia effusa]GAB18251.1 hypothetical protein GOEFS_050_00290 [Gordonia effusa NBRC 100432]